MTYAIYIPFIFLAAFGCNAQSTKSNAGDNAFGEYWYQGKAEISTYQLSQSRYDSIHDGEAVMIFVTEDIHRKLHVKPDDPERFQKDAVKVLKLNLLQEFVTGIYKYSLMTSVFTPVDRRKEDHSLKVTFSCQDWCGQDFYQYNWKGNRYEVIQRSYFESAGDRSFSLMNPWLEDELWTRIRIDPEDLPIGKIRIVPSAAFVRMQHGENKVYDAEAIIVTGYTQNFYRLTYPSLDRQLTIWYEPAFPYRILMWEEKNKGKMTSGKLLNTVMDDYWNHHFPKDEVLRNELELKDK